MKMSIRSSVSVLLTSLALVASVMVAGASSAAPAPYPHTIHKVNATDTQMTLMWWPISGAKAYAVCITPNNMATSATGCINGRWEKFFPRNGEASSPLSNKNYTYGVIAGLSPLTNYKFQVIAYGDTGATWANRKTNYSPAKTHQTAQYAVSPPSGLSLAAGNNNSLVASWNPVGNSSYEVRFAQAPNSVSKPTTAAPCSPANCVRSETNSVTIPNLVDGTTYAVSVRAVDQTAGGGADPFPRSNWSANVSRLVKHYPIGLPQWDTATDLARTDFTLRWSAPAGYNPAQHKFLVYVSDASGIRGTGARTDAWLTTGTSLYVTGSNGSAAHGGGITAFAGTAAGRDYFANIAVVPADFTLSSASNADITDAARLSDYPPQTRVTLKDNNYAQVRDIVQSSEGNQLKLTWRQVPRASSNPYRIYYSQQPTGTAQSACVVDSDTSDGTVSHVFPADLEPATTYYIEIALADASASGDGCGAGIGVWPPFRTAYQTPNPFPLAAPSPFRMTGTGTTSVQLEWGHTTGGLNPRYEIEYRYESPANSGPNHAPLLTAANATSVNVTGLIQNRAYLVRVRAVNASGQPLSPWSVRIQATPKTGVGSISGQVAGPAASYSLLHAFAYVQGTNRDGELMGVVRVASDGKYTIPNLPPGTYRVQLEQGDPAAQFVSPWVHDGTPRIDHGVRTRGGATSFTVSCGSTCTTPSVGTTTILADIGLSGTLPNNAGGADVTAQLKGNNACTSNDAGRSNVRSTRVGASATTYSLRGLFPSAMQGGTYCVYVTKGATTLATKELTLPGTGNAVWNFTGGAPAMPTGLTVAATGPNSGSVSWNASSGATTYRLWYGTDPNGKSPKPVMKEVSGATSTTLTGLSPNTTYYVDISAIGGDGAQSGYTSPRKSFKTTAGSTPSAPPIPAGLTVAATGPNSGSVSWNASSGATTYRLWYGTDPNGKSPKPVMKEVSGATSTTLTGLSPNTTYYVDISAIGAGGQSAYTSPRKPFTTTAGSTPSAPPTPAGFTAQPSGALSWTASAGATNYRIWYGTNQNGTGATKREVGAVTSTTLPNLAPSTTYYVDIAAIGPGGLSAYTTPRKTFTTGSSTGGAGTTGVPSGVKVINVGLNEVSIGWNAVPDAASYRLYWGSNNNGSGLSGPFTPATNAFTATSPHTCNYFTLAAVDASGTAGPWTVGNVLAARFPQPTNFGTPQCVNVYKPASKQLSMSWAAVPDAVGYRVYYGTAAAGGAQGKGMKYVDVSGGDTTHLILTGLTAGTRYHVQVAAKPAGGGSWSAYSNPASVSATA